ncbi:hypothetical protein DL546_009586 [Coniochaeta pulveracea]|uniref:Uncharacterized protein n=1 Tax=Coniochaeta pulveracea TaxID=177199 RepID=A0A420YM81_9PEZI|nr:hypothetical protein DL546_009586 [Coniochaeta pulveracea]
MAALPGLEERRRQLQQLAVAWGVVVPPPCVPLIEQQWSTFRTSNDDRSAEEVLQRRRKEAEQHNPQSGLRKAFASSKRKPWDPREIYDALDECVTTSCRAGVAEALVLKLTSTGGNLNIPHAKKPLLGRRKSVDSVAERTSILQKAVERRERDLVAVLVPHADTNASHRSLPIAIRNRDGAIIGLLLKHGASAAQTKEGENAFTQLCTTGDRQDLVQAILQSDGPPSPSCVSEAMVGAVATPGCYDTVLHLSRSTADGNHRSAAALKAAITLRERQAVLAILTGRKPPSGNALNEAFQELFSQPSPDPGEKMILTKALLCAGASGDVVAAALIQACESEWHDMVELLVRYGASVEYQDAEVVRKAVSKGQSALTDLLLLKTTTLIPFYASDCIKYLPKNLSPNDRHALLKALLKKGAAGQGVDEALVDAVTARDYMAVELLLTPHITGGPAIPGSVGHATASVDYHDGEALKIAVTSRDIQMVKRLIDGTPSSKTLSMVFPHTWDLPPTDRYQSATIFLATGLTGSCIASTLQKAVAVKPPLRDDNFIDLLLSHKADVNFDDGTIVVTAIRHGDAELLGRLARRRISPGTAAAGVRAAAFGVIDRSLRLGLMNVIIDAATGTEDVCSAMVHVLETKPVDTKLMGLLLTRGKASVNYREGVPLQLAVADPNPAVLGHILQRGQPSPATLDKGLMALSDLPSSAPKAAKLEMLVRSTTNAELLSKLLVDEVLALINLPGEQRTLAVLKILLSSGADINAQSGKALCGAISKADTPICDLLFEARPSAASLAQCMPYALNISDPMDRLTFTKRAVQAGAPALEVNTALIHAVKKNPDDISLITILASRADMSDGEALASAVQQEQTAIVELLLSAGGKKCSAAILNTNLTNAMTKITDRARRLEMCSLLLLAGASGPCVSEALVRAAAEGDIALGTVLLEKGGATVEHQDGKAILEACRAGAADVLAMLLSTGADIKNMTLAQGFQAATEIGDLVKRADVFRLLLNSGVAGEVVDAQLISAARYGERGETLVELLLKYGADANYKEGEAVQTAARSAILGSLALMLGVVTVGDRQKKPSRVTISKALKVSWKLSREARFRVIDLVFKAGYAMKDEQKHLSLITAVQNEPDLRLIELLLKQGASPLPNGCQCLVETAKRQLLDALALFLEQPIPQVNLDSTFRQTFPPELAQAWLSPKGYAIAEMLLKKGSRGEGLSLMLSAVIDVYGGEQDDLARRFVQLLTDHEVNVDHDHGIVLQNASKKADSELIQQLLDRNPNAHTISMAFPYIFAAGLIEDDILALIDLFAEYCSGEERLGDIAMSHPEFKPVLFEAISHYPRSVKIVQALLDAGFYHDQKIMHQVMSEHREDEEVNMLLWALLQPRKMVSDSVLDLLIRRGARVDFQTRISGTTPLMTAVQTKRKDIVNAILIAGVGLDVVDIVDATGNTALTLATRVGGDIGATMMDSILLAEPSKNDGSLHVAARQLNLAAVRALVEHGHDVDFPSPIHGGRSALAEVCCNASHAGPLTVAQQKDMEKTMMYLLDNGSDPAIQSDGRSVLLLALESGDPVQTTRILLKVGMWKHVNAEFNNYTDGTCIYSPTQYVLRIMPQSDTTSELLTLLRHNRAKDTYYALTGPQPQDAINLPDELKRSEHLRLERLARITAETEDHQRSLARTKEAAALQDAIFTRRAQLEATKARQETDLLRDRGAVEDELFARSLHRKQLDYDANIQYEQNLASAGARRVRQLGEAEMEVQEKKNRLMMDFERQLGGERFSKEQEMSTLRLKEKREVDRLEGVSDKRIMGRLEAQRNLVEKQDGLASKLVGAGANQKQIGYVVGELD